jgi:hypothetical protein
MPAFRLLKFPALLIVLWTCVTALLTLPRLNNAEFGAQGDLSVHYHLLRAFWRSAQEGDGLPQWAGLLDGGRGDAIFTFYPPLAYWLGALFIYASSASLLGVLKFLTIVSLWLAQCSAYQLARHFLLRPVSALVSVMYVALPTFALLALHRAFLPNALALALTPFVLLGAWHLLKREKQWQGFWLFTLSLSALILTHVITTYLVVWLLLLLLFSQSELPSFLRLSLAGATALALTAFFWLPQMLEMSWVQVGLQIAQQDFRQYLLFAPLTRDTPFGRAWHGLNELASAMTLLQTAVSVACVIMLWRIRPGALKRWAIAIVLFGLLISLPWSVPLWRVIPGLAFIQFPWRWQPFAALGTAILTALVIAHWQSIPRVRRLTLTPIITLGGLSLIILTAQIVRAPQAESESLPAAFHQSFNPIPFYYGREMHDDLKGVRLALAANQVYFRPLAAGQDLYPATERYGGLTILSGRGNVVAQQLSNQRRSFQLNAAEPLHVRLETYAYPHWSAQLDGKPLAWQSLDGLMQCEIPAGMHTLTFEFAPRSFLYRAARWLSVITWLVLAGIAIRQLWARLINR